MLKMDKSMSVATLQCQLKKSKNLLACKIVYKKEGIGLLQIEDKVLRNQVSKGFSLCKVV